MYVMYIYLLACLHHRGFDSPPEHMFIVRSLYIHYIHTVCTFHNIAENGLNVCTYVCT
jgi:hypothetical protein